MPGHILTEYYAKRRRRLREVSGGLHRAVADNVFEETGSGLVPVTTITAADVLAPATFIIRCTVQTLLDDNVFLGANNAFGLLISAGDFAFVAPGFSVVFGIESPIPMTSGSYTIVMGVDPATENRINIHVNGIPMFNGTDAGFTTWDSDGENWSFGLSDTVEWHSFEIYLNRLPGFW